MTGYIVFFPLCHVVTIKRHAFAYYVIKYKPIDIRGKNVINDIASNHNMILLIYSKVRGSDRCERQRGEPKNQDISGEIINFQILYWPAAHSLKSYWINGTVTGRANVKREH